MAVSSKGDVMERQQPVLCPSSQCKDGAIVLGIVLPNQTIAYADQRFKIDAGQAAEMQRNPVTPVKRFRFSSPCAQCGCGQWIKGANGESGGRCGVIEEVLEAPRPEFLPRTLPECSIRPQCRWFLQRGEEACSVCRYVVTDTAVITEEQAAELVA
jgi:hypothetical protein